MLSSEKIALFHENIQGNINKSDEFRFFKNYVVIGINFVSEIRKSKEEQKIKCFFLGVSESFY